MRILYVINTGLVGGLQQHVLTLMRALKGVAETAVVLNAILDEKVVALFEDAGMKVYRLDGKSGHDWRVIGRFRKVLADFRPDVIHAHGLPILVAVDLCPNLIITPHIGGSSYDVQVCGTEMVAASLDAYLDGLTPPHRVA